MLIITVTRPLASSIVSTSPSKFSNVAFVDLHPVARRELDVQLRRFVGFFFLGLNDAGDFVRAASASACRRRR